MEPARGARHRGCRAFERRLIDCFPGRRCAPARGRQNTRPLLRCGVAAQCSHMATLLEGERHRGRRGFAAAERCAQLTVAPRPSRRAFSAVAGAQPVADSPATCPGNGVLKPLQSVVRGASSPREPSSRQWRTRPMADCRPGLSADRVVHALTSVRLPSPPSASTKSRPRAPRHSVPARPRVSSPRGREWKDSIARCKPEYRCSYSAK